jgi:hypothetical protein
LSRVGGAAAVLAGIVLTVRSATAAAASTVVIGDTVPVKSD